MPAAWMVLANSTCLSVRLPSGLSARSFDRISSEFSGVRSSWLMLARNSRLVSGGQRQLLGLLLERASWPARPRGSWSRPRCFWISSRRAFSSSSSLVCLQLVLLLAQELFGLAQRRGLLLQAVVGLLQLLLLALQLGGQQLRLLQQPFGAHVGGDRVEHDADRFVSWSRKDWWVSVKRAERGELDDRLDLCSNSTGRTMMLSGAASPSAELMRDVVRRHVGRAGCASSRRRTGRPGPRAGGSGSRCSCAR